MIHLWIVGILPGHPTVKGSDGGRACGTGLDSERCPLWLHQLFMHFQEEMHWDRALLWVVFQAQILIIQPQTLRTGQRIQIQADVHGWCCGITQVNSLCTYPCTALRQTTEMRRDISNSLLREMKEMSLCMTLVRFRRTNVNEWCTPCPFYTDMSGGVACKLYSTILISLFSNIRGVWGSQVRPLVSIIDTTSKWLKERAVFQWFLN